MTAAWASPWRPVDGARCAHREGRGGGSGWLGRQPWWSCCLWRPARRRWESSHVGRWCVLVRLTLRLPARRLGWAMPPASGKGVARGAAIRPAFAACAGHGGTGVVGWPPLTGAAVAEDGQGERRWTGGRGGGDAPVGVPLSWQARPSLRARGRALASPPSVGRHAHAIPPVNGLAVGLSMLGRHEEQRPVATSRLPPAS